MTKEERLKKMLTEAEERRDKIDREIAELVAERDRKDVSIERQVDALKDVPNEEREREIEKRLLELRLGKREATKEVRRLRPRRKRATEAIGRFEDRLENLVKPKVIVLDLEFRAGMAGQGTITATIGHHTGGPTDDDLEDALRLWRQYHAQHLAQGWNGEGYHYGITRGGVIVILRPVGFAGAHTLNANTGHPGIVCHGTTGDKPTLNQRRSLRYLLKYAHTDRFPARGRASRRLLDVPCTGHNDWNATACPATHKPMYVSKGRVT